MSKVVVKIAINVSADNVWKTISEFKEVERFAPWVASSSVEGTGEGAKRTIIMKDGVQLLERLERLDEQKRILRFSIIDSSSPLPFKNYIGTLQVQALSENQCEVQWLSNFEVQGIPEVDIIAKIEGMHSLAIKEIEKLFSGN